MDMEDDMIQLILAFSMIMTPEEFEEEYETPMPTSDEEDAFILNLSTQTEDNSGEILIVTENLFTIQLKESYNLIMNLQAKLNSLLVMHLRI